jgi:pimeloyl-ACP methyl ester carboxylesterase
VADVPRTRYVESVDGLYIAYQVVGDGPLDLAWLPQTWFNAELYWDDPFTARFLRRLSSFGRLILFDKRGSGLSDPVAGRVIPTVEEWVDDLMTVLDAVGSAQAHLIGMDAGGPVALVAAGTHSSRVSSRCSTSQAKTPARGATWTSIWFHGRPANPLGGALS